MRGPATVIARMMSALMTPPSSIHFGDAEGVTDPGQRPSREQQDGERDTGSDQRGGRDRLEAPDAISEPSLDGDLHRAAEAGGQREESRYSGRAHSADAIRSVSP